MTLKLIELNAQGHFASIVHLKPFAVCVVLSCPASHAAGALQPPAAPAAFDN
jgi:hypothetical protein